MTKPHPTTPELKAGNTWERLEDFVREHVQQFIQALLEEEVTELLGRAKSARREAVDVAPGYRNGYGKPRQLTLTTHHYTHLVQQHCSVLILLGFSIVGRFSAPLKKLTVINCLVTVCKTQRPPSRAAAQTRLFRVIPNRKLAAVTSTAWLGPASRASLS